MTLRKTLSPTNLGEETNHANVHKSLPRRSSDTGELRRSSDRSPAISTGKRKQSRAHHSDQRHSSREDREGVGSSAERSGWTPGSAPLDRRSTKTHQQGAIEHDDHL